MIGALQILKVIIFSVKVLVIGKMGVIILVHGIKIGNKDMEKSNGLTVILTKVIFIITTGMEKALIFGMMVLSILVHGKMITDMVMEKRNGLMVILTKANIIEIKVMEKVTSDGQMVR